MAAVVGATGFFAAFFAAGRREDEDDRAVTSGAGGSTAESGSVSWSEGSAVVPVNVAGAAGAGWGCVPY